jgi:hypothetical protein
MPIVAACRQDLKTAQIFSSAGNKYLMILINGNVDDEVKWERSRIVNWKLPAEHRTEPDAKTAR